MDEIKTVILWFIKVEGGNGIGYNHLRDKVRNRMVAEGKAYDEGMFSLCISDLSAEKKIKSIPYDKMNGFQQQEFNRNIEDVFYSLIEDS